VTIIDAVLRDTQLEDLNKVEEFYERVPEKEREYLVLHLEDHRAAIKKGLHFIVEHDKKIVASTMVNPPREGSSYAEAGNTLISSPVDECRLQKLFLEIRAAALAATEPDVTMITGVNPNNLRSYRNVSSTAELARVENPPAEVFTLCKICKWSVSIGIDRGCCCDFFVLHSDDRRRLVRKFVDRIDGRTVLELDKRDGRRVRLALESMWASNGLQLRVLRAIAEGQNGLS
jgi:hypothetical protein